MGDFNYSRLEVARKRRGLTKTALAKRAGISARSLTAYERGEKEPGALTVARLADAVGFPKDFLARPDLDEPPRDGSSFRALSSLTARQRDQALGSASLAMDLADWIDKRFKLPDPDVPRLRGVDPETAAEAVRSAWGLGERKAPNMVHLLEAHGVRVFSLAEESVTVDAFSFWRDGEPFVFLNNLKTSERSRMDAAHELGHLVLHWRGGAQGRRAESEAQAFGSAFLMPRGSVLAEAPRGGRLSDLIKAKRRWNVGVANLAYRMHGLDLLTDWQYRSLFIEMSQRGYRKNEPREIPRETSQLLARVFREMQDEGTTRTSIARQLSLPIEELSKIVFGLIPRSLMGEGKADSVGPRQRADLKVVS